MNTPTLSRRALPILQRAEMALRVAVCHSCSRRPPGSESLGADVPLTCEPGCEVFRQLPRLVQTARCLDPMLRSVEGTLDNRIRDICKTTPAPPPDGHGPRPLMHHRKKITATLAKLIRH